MLFYSAIIAAIVLRFVLPRWQRNPPNRFIAAIVKPRGVQRMQDEAWETTDYRRAAKISAIAALVLAGLTWLAETVIEKTTNGDPLNLVASGVLMFGGIGFLMAVAMTVMHLVRVMRSKRASSTRDA